MHALSVQLLRVTKQCSVAWVSQFRRVPQYGWRNDRDFTPLMGPDEGIPEAWSLNSGLQVKHYTRNMPTRKVLGHKMQRVSNRPGESTNLGITSNPQALPPHNKFKYYCACRRLH